MVLGKLPMPRRPTILITVGQGPTASAVGAGGVVWTFLHSSILFFSIPSLWETARYRLKYRLKWAVKPKTTNYIGPSPRDRDKEKRKDRGSKKMSKRSPPSPTASAIGPCPTITQNVGCPGTGSLPRTIAPPDHPLKLSKRCRNGNIVFLFFLCRPCCQRL